MRTPCTTDRAGPSTSESQSHVEGLRQDLIHRGCTRSCASVWVSLADSLVSFTRWVTRQKLKLANGLCFTLVVCCCLLFSHLPRASKWLYGFWRVMFSIGCDGPFNIFPPKYNHRFLVRKRSRCRFRVHSTRCTCGCSNFWFLAMLCRYLLYDTFREPVLLCNTLVRFIFCQTQHHVLHFGLRAGTVETQLFGQCLGFTGTPKTVWARGGRRLISGDFQLAKFHSGVSASRRRHRKELQAQHIECPLDSYTPV